MTINTPNNTSHALAIEPGTSDQLIENQRAKELAQLRARDCLTGPTRSVFQFAHKSPKATQR